MARSWQYPRWRRVVVQIVLWAVLGASVGVAALVVRHKRLVGSVQLAGPRSVDLPGGVRLTVRLPKRWPVDRDAAEHPGGTDEGAAAEPGEPVAVFEAHAPPGDGDDGDGGTDVDPANGPEGRQLTVRCQFLPAAVPARELLGRRGAVAVADGPPDEAAAVGGPAPVAGVAGAWAVVIRDGRPAYVAAAAVPAGPATPTPLAVWVELTTPGGDPAGDRDLLRRVAAAVAVDRDRAAAAVPAGRPSPGRAAGR